MQTTLRLGFIATSLVLLGGCPAKDTKTEATSEATSTSKSKSDDKKADDKKSDDKKDKADDKKDKADDKKSAAKPAESASSAPAADVPPPTAFAGKQIDAGNVASGAWVDTFRYERTVNPDASKLIPAAEACKAKGYALCTSDQFERACAADAAVGASPAWTASFDSSGKFIVRGPSCSATASKEPGAEVAGAGLSCCTRAISMESSNKNVAFLRTTGTAIAELEAASQKGDEPALAKIYAPMVDFYATKIPGASAAEKTAAVYKSDGALWLEHSHCSVDLDPQKDIWWATCEKTTFQGGKLSAGTAKYNYQGAAKVLDSVTQEKLAREPAAP